MSFLIILTDWLFEIFTVQLPIILGCKFTFWIVYLCIKNPGLVDFAYVVDHFALGLSLYLMHANTGDIKPIILISLLFIWALRLGGFIFYNRILSCRKDERY